ncbi:MAG: hypothetical protein AMJ62_00905 [Myxococcales bacterium SG8_38]|nr:MAG: hypothetical protein AMJ62_00905 [Myxococcales bacterium SG8_38]
MPTRRWDGRIDPSSDWEAGELKSRTCAGLWSARITLVASMPFGIVAWAKGIDDAWLMFMLLPVVAAFFSGSLFGAGIGNPHQVPDECLAGRRGVFVALCAYILFAMEVAAMSVTPIETGLNVFMGSLIISGWLAFPVAFFAGMMAFRAREGAMRYRFANRA